MSEPAGRPVRVTPRAASELDAAFAWYELQRGGLGTEFLRAVEAALAGAARHPAMYPAVHGRVRRALLRRFPYGVFYLEEPDAVVVLGVIHAHQDPRDWPRGAEG